MPPSRVTVVVVGSLNHDIAVRLPRVPRRDETLVAHDISEFRGGKGYNQATAASRLGAAVAMVGCVGDDAAGYLLRDGLNLSGIDSRHVVTVDSHTGTAIPLIFDDGEVSIVIVPGANAELSVAMVEASTRVFDGAQVVLLQGEIPIEASMAAAALAHRVGAVVVVNPAPVGVRSSELVATADLIVVNRGEAKSLNLEPSDRVIVTLGSEGALVGSGRVPAFRTTVLE